MDPLAAYIDGWRHHDAEAILATVTDDCTVIESFGPVYRGADRIRQWVEVWIAAGSQVLDWTVSRQFGAGDFLVAEWTFTYRQDGAQQRFQGATIAHLRDGRIDWLREYRQDGELYDWTGVWR